MGRDGMGCGYPPSPQSLKVLLGAGFAKSLGKILLSKNLEVKDDYSFDEV